MTRVALDAIVERGHQDPLIQVVGRTLDGKRAHEAEHAGAAADLGRAGSTSLDVGRQARRVSRHEVIEQEQIDELASACAIEGGTDVRVRHITYMT
jgi:hypothetical protein